ncbi:Glutamine amidotransferase-like class 1 domain-containing protein 1 [Nymphon striatum]|nr:Glutamine amidotransferase-like class 1 domain-containing protein 1 [Nymphon striatum]
MGLWQVGGRVNPTECSASLLKGYSTKTKIEEIKVKEVPVKKNDDADDLPEQAAEKVEESEVKPDNGSTEPEDETKDETTDENAEENETESNEAEAAEPVAEKKKSVEPEAEKKKSVEPVAEKRKSVEPVESTSPEKKAKKSEESATKESETPEGKPLDFANIDDQSRRWLSDFRVKSLSKPLSLQTIDPNRYSSLVIPHCPGAITDLAHNADMGAILQNFLEEKKPICAIGMGVAALFAAVDSKTEIWNFRPYTMTSSSVFELARNSDFNNLSMIPEDTIKERGGLYSCTEMDEIHVVVDRHLITGQNEQSTLTAIQNLILKCSQKQKVTSRLK